MKENYSSWPIHRRSRHSRKYSRGGISFLDMVWITIAHCLSKSKVQEVPIPIFQGYSGILLNFLIPGMEFWLSRIEWCYPSSTPGQPTSPVLSLDHYVNFNCDGVMVIKRKRVSMMELKPWHLILLFSLTWKENQHPWIHCVCMYI